MIKRNLFFLYLMELCAGSARGAYLVCIGWTTLIVSGDVAAVGQVFIVAMITTMFVGPVIGVTVGGVKCPWSAHQIKNTSNHA